MLGTASGIGIGIGIGFVVAVGVFFVMNQGTPALENIPDLVYNDPKLASIQTAYFDESNRLVVALILTDKNAEYTTADGALTISVQKDGRQVYSEEYEFKKGDFLSWRNNLTGEKTTGYRVDIKQYFPSGSHDVFVNMVTTSGTTWEDLHDSFYSLE